MTISMFLQKVFKIFRTDIFSPNNRKKMSAEMRPHWNISYRCLFVKKKLFFEVLPFLFQPPVRIWLWDTYGLWLWGKSCGHCKHNRLNERDGETDERECVRVNAWERERERERKIRAGDHPKCWRLDNYVMVCATLICTALHFYNKN